MCRRVAFSQKSDLVVRPVHSLPLTVGHTWRAPVSRPFLQVFFPRERVFRLAVAVGSISTDGRP